MWEGAAPAGPALPKGTDVPSGSSPATKEITESMQLRSKVSALEIFGHQRIRGAELFTSVLVEMPFWNANWEVLLMMLSSSFWLVRFSSLASSRNSEAPSLRSPPVRPNKGSRIVIHNCCGLNQASGIFHGGISDDLVPIRFVLFITFLDASLELPQKLDEALVNCSFHHLLQCRAVRQGALRMMTRCTNGQSEGDRQCHALRMRPICSEGKEPRRPPVRRVGGLRGRRQRTGAARLLRIGLAAPTLSGPPPPTERRRPAAAQ